MHPFPQFRWIQRRLPGAALAACFLTSLGGCQTVRDGVSESVEIRTVPPAARIHVNGDYVGLSPVSVELSRKRTHQVRIEREGYRTAYEFITPEMVPEAREGIRFGLLADAGYYSRFYPNPVDRRLDPEFVPLSKGVDPYAEFTRRVLEVDALRRTGKLDEREHRYIVSQLIAFFTEN